MPDKPIDLIEVCEILLGLPPAEPKEWPRMTDEQYADAHEKYLDGRAMAGCEEDDEG